VDAGVPTPEDLRAAERVFANVGAVVLGRRMFDVGIGLWGEDGAFGRPTFVVTHRPTADLVKGPTTFTFVTDGGQGAITQARAAAGGDRDVLISGGADIVQQCLVAGLVDEVRLHLVPVLLGSGTALFDGSSCRHELETIDAIVTTNAVHLTYRVVGATRAAASPAERPDLPAGIGRPARSALAAAGYTHLDQLADVDPTTLARLHGVGPKALRLIRDALAGRSASTQ
jgi:dihydrofolate reductase